MKRTLCQIIFAAAAVIILMAPAGAVKLNIQELTASNGIKFWFVEDKTLPIVNLKMAWRGGAATENPAENGLTQLMVSLLDEGAGDLTAHDFKARLTNRGIRLSFGAGADTIYGAMKFILSEKDEALYLLKQALQNPNFKPEALERMRTTLINNRRSAIGSPRVINGENWWQLAFGEHPYARPSSGTLTTLGKFNRQDVVNRYHAHIARDNLVLAIIGHLSAKEAIDAVERVFTNLPEKARLNPIQDIAMIQAGQISYINYPTPQSEILYGLAGIGYDEPNFFAAYVMNYILGGGGFAARLMEEIREKRGLAYGAYSYFSNYQHTHLWMGNIATAHENTNLVLDLLKQEMQRMKKTAVSEQELENAKSYLTGSYFLRFDSGDKIVSQLLNLQLIGFDKNYITTRNEKIEKVTAKQIQAIAQRILTDDKLVVSIITNQPPHE